MRIRQPISTFVLVLVLALSACGGGAGGTAGSVDAGADPKAELDRARAALTASRTGVSTAEVTITDSRTKKPAATYAWHGAFDVTSQRWSSKFSQTSPGESGKAPEAVFAYVGEGERAFARPEYPSGSNEAGEWMRADVTADQAGPRFSVDLLAVLRFAEAKAVRTGDRGRSIVTTVPLGIALQILGLSKGANVFEIDLSALPGAAELELAVDGAGTPTGAALLGSSATGVESLPDELALILASSRWSLTLRDLGAAVDISVPRTGKRIDPDALQEHLERQKRRLDEKAP